MTISVITSTYNHARYLDECVHSIFNQELKPVEAIIIDDASQDDTQTVLNALVVRYPQIISIKNEKNMGPARNLNYAISIAKGDYIIGCAADDFLLPGFYIKSLEFMTQHPDLGFCFGDTLEFHDTNPRKFILRKPFQSEMPLVFNVEAVKKLFRSHQVVIPSHSTIYRKSTMIENGGFDPNLQSICDWYLNVAIALKCGFGYIPQPFSAYRHTSESYAKKVYKNSASRRAVLSHLHQVLGSKNTQVIKDDFKSLGLFAYLNYRFFYDFIMQPRYWNLTWASFPKKIKFVISYRFMNFWRKIISLAGLNIS